MMYEDGEELYYVCPCVFIIEKVKISMAVQELNCLYYIDHTGAYLREENLFRDFLNAKKNAFKKLNEFYNEKQQSLSKLVEGDIKLAE